MFWKKFTSLCVGGAYLSLCTTTTIVDLFFGRVFYMHVTGFFDHIICIATGEAEAKKKHSGRPLTPSISFLLFELKTKKRKLAEQKGRPSGILSCSGHVADDNSGASVNE